MCRTSTLMLSEGVKGPRLTLAGAPTEHSAGRPPKGPGLLRSISMVRIELAAETVPLDVCIPGYTQPCCTPLKQETQLVNARQVAAQCACSRVQSPLPWVGTQDGGGRW